MNISWFTLLCLGLFLLIYGIQHATNLQVVWMGPVGALAALIAGILCIFDVIRGRKK